MLEIIVGVILDNQTYFIEGLSDGDNDEEKQSEVTSRRFRQR